MNGVPIYISAPSLRCDCCSDVMYPAGLFDDYRGRFRAIVTLHRIEAPAFDVSRQEYHVTGFTQADLENEARESGWKLVTVYTRDLWVCQECQKIGTAPITPQIQERIRELELLLALRSITLAPTLEHAKVTAIAALKDGEKR